MAISLSVLTGLDTSWQSPGIYPSLEGKKNLNSLNASSNILTVVRLNTDMNVNVVHVFGEYLQEIFLANDRQSQQLGDFLFWHNLTNLT